MSFKVLGERQFVAAKFDCCRGTIPRSDSGGIDLSHALRQDAIGFWSDDECRIHSAQQLLKQESLVSRPVDFDYPDVGSSGKWKASFKRGDNRATLHGGNIIHNGL